AFYEAFGLRRRLRDLANVAFFEAGGVVLGLYSRSALAEEAGVELPRTAATTLACNLESKAAVDAQIERAAAAGGTLTAPAQDRFWGGYSGYVADPDGSMFGVFHPPSA
ncbi:MAG: VOC family protein, partial [Actinomycetota bacterium]